MNLNKQAINKLLLDQIDAQDFFTSHLQLVKKGSRYAAVCIFHGDKNPSLYVNFEQKRFYCFGCLASGNIIDFLIRKENLTYEKAVEALTKQYGINLQSSKFNLFENKYSKQQLNLYKTNEIIKNLFHTQLLFKMGGNNIEAFINKRKLDFETIVEFQIGVALNDELLFQSAVKTFEDLQEKNLVTLGLIRKYQNQNSDTLTKPFFNNCLIFPIYNQDNFVVGFSGRAIDETNQVKYLNSIESLIFAKNTIFFNSQNIQWNTISELYIVEGYFDAIALYKNGIKNVVATMGVVLSQSHINFLKQHKNIKSINLAFDNDEAGIKANKQNYLLLTKAGFNTSLIDLLDFSYKDADEFFNANENKAKAIYLQNKLSFAEYFYKYYKNQNLTTIEFKVALDELIKQVYLYEVEGTFQLSVTFLKQNYWFEQSYLDELEKSREVENKKHAFQISKNYSYKPTNNSNYKETIKKPTIKLSWVAKKTINEIIQNFEAIQGTWNAFIANLIFFEKFNSYIKSSSFIEYKFNDKKENQGIIFGINEKLIESIFDRFQLSKIHKLNQQSYLNKVLIDFLISDEFNKLKPNLFTNKADFFINLKEVLKKGIEKNNHLELKEFAFEQYVVDLINNFKQQTAFNMSSVSAIEALNAYYLEQSKTSNDELLMLCEEFVARINRLKNWIKQLLNQLFLTQKNN